MYPPETLDAQHNRLVALRQFRARDIPCELWGEEALSFAHTMTAHCALTALFDQQILVPAEFLDRAAAILEEG